MIAQIIATNDDYLLERIEDTIKTNLLVNEPASRYERTASEKNMFLMATKKNWHDFKKSRKWGVFNRRRSKGKGKMVQIRRPKNDWTLNAMLAKKVFLVIGTIGTHQP